MRESNTYQIFTEQQSTAESQGILVQDYRHVVLEIVFNGFTGTLKFAGSIQPESPDFSAAQGLENAFSFIQTKDLQDGSSIDGDTGLAKTSASEVLLVEANVNSLKHFAAIVSSYSVGSVSVRLLGSSN